MIDSFECLRRDYVIKITAILCVRNEAKYLSVTLSHLINNGIRIAIIDNESSDDSENIFYEFRDSIVYFRKLPYSGVFSLSDQLKAKEKAAHSIDSDWIIHLDADEIMESPATGETLREGIERVDGFGYTAVNFDEFVFLPKKNECFEYRDFYQSIKNYYFFEPKPLRLLRAWRKDAGLRQTAGGHSLRGRYNLYPENFILRHYIVLSQDHATEKYSKRRFSQEDLKKGWHRNRINLDHEDMALPEESSLHRLQGEKDFVKTQPRNKHFWEFE